MKNKINALQPLNDLKKKIKITYKSLTIRIFCCLRVCPEEEQNLKIDTTKNYVVGKCYNVGPSGDGKCLTCNVKHEGNELNFKTCTSCFG